MDGEWGKWPTSHCSKSCGGGQRTATRIKQVQAKFGGEDFKGNEGKGTQLVLGKDLFIKGFDKQLIGVKKNENKNFEVVLTENFPEKEIVKIGHCDISMTLFP